LVKRKPLTLRLGPPFLSYAGGEHGNGTNWINLLRASVMTQNSEQSRKAMEKYADLFERGIKASPWG
jgi:hypothetical protein